MVKPIAFFPLISFNRWCSWLLCMQLPITSLTAAYSLIVAALNDCAHHNKTHTISQAYNIHPRRKAHIIQCFTVAGHHQGRKTTVSIHIINLLININLTTDVASGFYRKFSLQTINIDFLWIFLAWFQIKMVCFILNDW